MGLDRQGPRRARPVEGSDLTTLDPQISRDRPTEIVLEHLYNRLVKWQDPKLARIVPDLAESWSVSGDGLTWTFKLRRGVTFSDGSPVNAAAVKFTIERILDRATGSPNRVLFTAISRVEVVDEHTVRFHTERPFAPLLENLATTSGAILSPPAVQRWKPHEYGLHPVGTGPFMLQEWKPGVRAVLVLNPRFFGQQPTVKRIVYRSIPEGAARVVALESGEAHVVTRIPPEAVDMLRRNPRVEVLVLPSTFQVSLEMNLRKKPFNDIRVRKALNYAIDRKAIVEKILRGFGAEPDGIFPPGVQARVKLPTWEYSPAKARQLLAEAGYPRGFTTTIWTPEGRYLKDKEVVEAVQGYLAQIDVRAEIRVWEWAAYQRALYSPAIVDADMWLLGTSIPTADWRLTRKFLTDDPSNLTGYSKPEIDSLLLNARSSTSYFMRVEFYKQIQRTIWDEAPWIFLYNQSQILGVQKGIKGLQVFGYEIVLLDRVVRE